MNRREKRRNQRAKRKPGHVLQSKPSANPVDPQNWRLVCEFCEEEGKNANLPQERFDRIEIATMVDHTELAHPDRETKTPHFRLVWCGIGPAPDHMPKIARRFGPAVPRPM